MERKSAPKENLVQSLEKEAIRTTRFEQKFVDTAGKIARNKAVGIFSLTPIVAAGAIGLGKIKAGEENIIEVCPTPGQPAKQQTLEGESLKDTSFDPQVIHSLIDTRTDKPFDFSPVENDNNTEQNSQPSKTQSENQPNLEQSRKDQRTLQQETEKKLPENFQITISQGSTVDWEIEKALKAAIAEKPSLLNPENPAENGNARWRQTLAVLTDNNLTANEVAIVWEGQEFNFKRGPNLTRVLAEQGVNPSSSREKNHTISTQPIVKEPQESLKVSNQIPETEEPEVSQPQNVKNETQDYSELEGKFVLSSAGANTRILVSQDLEDEDVVTPTPVKVKPTGEPPLEPTPKLEPSPEATPPTEPPPEATPPTEPPPEATPTLQPTPTVTETPPPTVTETPVPTETETATPTATATPTPTKTPTPTPSPTQIPTKTPTPTPGKVGVRVVEFPPTGTGAKVEDESFNTGLLAIILAIFGALLIPFGYFLRAKNQVGGGEK